MRTKIILSLLLVTWHTSDAANTWQPANFDYKENKRQLDTLIKFPEAKGKVSLTLNCFSQIQTNGKMKETACYSNNQYEQTFAAAVSKAAKKARVNPAVINGKPRKVFLQFRVEFTAEGKKDDRTETIGFYLNPGDKENVQAYGDDHIAGQRVISSSEAWNKACPHHSRFVVWVRSYLSEDGRAESPRIEHASGIVPTAVCQDAIKRTIVGSQFTPAISDGVPVPSTFVEIFGN